MKYLLWLIVGVTSLACVGERPPSADSSVASLTAAADDSFLEASSSCSTGPVALTLDAPAPFIAAQVKDVGPAIFSSPPVVKMPDRVSGKPGRMIQIRIEQTGKSLRYFCSDVPERADLFREYHPDEKVILLRFVSDSKGQFKIYAVCCDQVGEMSEFAVCTVSVGNGPDPGPGPQPIPPEPGPDPPLPPGPAGLRVLFVRETASNMTREQLNILNSTAIAEYLNRKAAKDAKGRPEWRRFDPDQNVEHESETWKKIWSQTKPQMTKLPAIVIITDKSGSVLPLPATEKETMELLKRYGGE